MHKLILGLAAGCFAFGQNAERTFHLDGTAALQEIATTLRTVGQIRQVAPGQSQTDLTVKGNDEELALVEWMVPKLELAAGGVQEYRASNDDLVVVYPLVRTATVTGMQEIVTTLRTVGDIRFVYAIGGTKTIPMRGSASQMALARFLIAELDQVPGERRAATVHSFPVPDQSQTAVVYGLAHAANATGIQEIITTIRTVLSLQKIYNNTGAKLLAFRDSTEMTRMAEWLISELDRTGPNAGANEMRMPGGKDDAVHVFYLAHLNSAKDRNTVLTTLRKTAGIMHAYTNSAPSALVVRGTGDRITLAGQLIAQADVAGAEGSR